MLRRFILIAGMACFSYSFAQKVELKTDEFSGASQYKVYLGEAKLEGGSFFTMRHVFLMLLGYPESKAEHSFIHIQTMTPQWVFIDKGETLILKVDGEFLKLSGDGATDRNVLTGSILQEFAIWPISSEDLIKLSKAKEIKFRIIGTKQVITGEFTDSVKKGIALYANEVLPKLIKETPKAQEATPK